MTILAVLTNFEKPQKNDRADDGSGEPGIISVVGREGAGTDADYCPAAQGIT
jgi:hypothetical protein